MVIRSVSKHLVLFKFYFQFKFSDNSFFSRDVHWKNYHFQQCQRKNNCSRKLFQYTNLWYRRVLIKGSNSYLPDEEGLDVFDVLELLSGLCCPPQCVWILHGTLAPFGKSAAHFNKLYTGSISFAENE